MSHIHEKIDLTVAAYIVHQRSILLIGHKQLKKWLPVGGHVELDEDPEQALFREIVEEAGISEKDLVVLGQKPDIVSTGTKFLYSPTYLDIHGINETHQHIGMTYFLKSVTDKIILAESEHNAIQWVSEEELDDMTLKLTPAVRFYASDAIKKLGWD